MKHLILVSLAVLFSISAFSQHQIHKRTGEILDVKIVEIGTDDVSFVYPGNDELVIKMDQALIRKVVLEGGQEVTFTAPSDDPDYYVDQRKRALKLNFLSPLTNYYIEGLYEQSIRPGRSFEVGLGVIGVGEIPDRVSGRSINFNGNNNIRYIYDVESARGVFVRGGLKLMNQPDKMGTRGRYSHILKGGYIKPEVVLGTYSLDITTENRTTGATSKESQGEVFGAFLINLGKQWVFDDIFLIDVSGGLGYGASTFNKSVGQYPVVLADTDGLGLALKGTVSIGVLLK